MLEPQYDTDRIEDAVEMAIKALKQQPCSNAIDRAEAIYIASGYCHPANIAKELAKVPPVTPEPKMGRWIEEDMYDGDVAYRCSECKELFWIESGTPKDNEYNFCPKCGKRLIESQESDHKCHTCKHYTAGEYDGSCGSYICKNYSDWESEEI